MLLLALDTSTSAVSVALHDGSSVVAESTVIDVRAHVEQLAPGIQEVLRRTRSAPDQLTHVVTGTGPGPFTALRVGVTTARMLALATGAALSGVCSLDALAFAAEEYAGVRGLLVATDARRKEVYWAQYAGHRLSRVSGPTVSRPDDLPEQVRDLPAAGRGPLLYPEVFHRPAGPLDVSASALADLAVTRLARGQTLEAATPRYLRRPDVAPATAPKSVLG
ncbi:MAG: tRNA (adenosine(37)-N6)-threonylcarbamoyltransferase complex dimerization subunit type 1 TsaB [Dermatophilaceae bacterium]